MPSNGAESEAFDVVSEIHFGGLNVCVRCGTVTAEGKCPECGGAVRPLETDGNQEHDPH